MKGTAAMSRRELFAGGVATAMTMAMTATANASEGALRVRCVDHTATTVWDHRQIHGTISVRPEESALVVIDPADNHPNYHWFSLMEQHLWERLLPLMARCRQKGMHVYVLPTSFGIHPWVSQGYYNDAYSQWWPDATETDAQWLDRKMRASGRKNLFYAGYAANYCVRNKPAGIEVMRRAPYRYRPVTFVRDASIGYESAESVAPGAMTEDLWWGNNWRAACYDVEARAGGYTTTIADMQNWFGVQ